MTDSNSTLLWYDQNAFHLCAAYEASPPRALQATLARWIRPEMQVLELACGSGRDARFMASLGARVTALDGSAAMVAKARKRAGGPEFLRLALPATRSELVAKGLLPDAQSDDGRFDAVVSIALLMHLADEALFLTLRNIANCCRKEGLAIVSFSPDHPAEDGRLFVKRTAQEVASSLEDFGFTVLESETTPDAAGRPFSWVTLVLRKSREAGSHRQRLQSVLFEDRKTATYKLALLRALCDIALAAPLAAQFVSETHVAVPMGLIVERWIAFYWPLAGLPQLSGHRPMEFEAALARLAALFAGDYFACRRGMEANRLDAPAREALGAVASVMLKTLKRGPIEHSGTSAGDRLFAWRKSEAAALCASPLEALRQTSGQLLLPGGLWREMKQNGLWFSDSILLQWAQLVEKFSGAEAPMGDVLSRLLSTQGSERDTAEARALYARKPDLACVWTGEPLAGRVFAVDHLLPWALTRTNDLWNLLPALPKANSAKSDKLPDFEFFLSRRDGIVDDWRWLADQDPELFARQSAQALLPAGLPAREWWNPLFDAAGRRLESLAQRLSAPRWRGL